MSATPDSTLADPEQLIADLRRQLAERTAERDEALQRETATAEVLGVINSSPGDLTPVFDAILEKALHLCEAAFGALLIHEGDDRHRIAAISGLSSERVDAWGRGPLYLGPGTSLYRLVRGERFVDMADAADDEDYRSGNPIRRALVDIDGARTWLAVPLRKDGVLLGAFTIYRREVRPFSDKQIAVVENFAAQAVIAMENARLLTETREALEQQTATAEVLQVINSSPGKLTPVFDAMLEKALRLCGATYGQLSTYDGYCFDVVAIQGEPRWAEWIRQRGPAHPEAGTTIGRIVAGERVIHVDDLTTEEAYLAGNPTRRALAEIGGFRTLLSVALRKDETVLGVLHVVRQEVRPFSDKQIALLQNFAAQAVIAMENARLITETCEALEQQTATAEVLQVINSSPGDLAPVFNAMLEKAVSLCGASHGILRTFDGRDFPLVAASGEPLALERLRQFRAVRPTPGGAFAAIAEGERVVHIADIRDTEQYRTNPDARQRSDLMGVRTWLAVALRSEDTLLGMIALYRQEVRPFSDKEIALVQNFAAQAVIAMENARLLGELRQRTEEVAELNRGLEARVAEQVDELGRVGRLKRFLAPQLAELIVSQGDEKILESHRREIVVVFCDLRGYTAFTETAEPEEVLEFLRQYHGALGPLVSQYEGTLDQFSGDGIMVFFNDPVPCPDPAERAVKMAMAMREAAATLTTALRRRRGRVLGFGAGIAQGYATLGQIGFADRSGYTAIGTVCNLAARLCAEAKDGQILVGQSVAVAVEETIPLEELGELALKGLTQPIVAYNVPLASIQPALRVIEGGPPSG